MATTAGHVRFKTPRIESEWPSVDEGLRREVLGFADWVAIELRKPYITITCAFRSKEENDEVGGKPNSHHLETPTKALDIRRWGWDQGQRDAAEVYWDSRQGYRFVVEGDHFHLQTA